MTDQAQAAAVKPGVWEAIVAWLRVVWVIYWRELRSIFTTIVAYVVIAATLLANGGVFCVLLWALLQP